MGHDIDTRSELTEEDAEFYAGIFRAEHRQTRVGSATPSPEQTAQYYLALEWIAAAHQHAEAQSAGLIVG